MRRLDKLNIAHVVYSFSYGGLERRIVRLIESLSPRNVEFLIVSLRPSRGTFIPHNDAVRHIVLDAKPGLDIVSIVRLARIFRDNEIHIAHSHNWVSMLEGVLAARLARVPVAVHGEHGAKRFESAELRWRRTLTQRLIARTADRVIPVNDSIRDRLAEVWHLERSRFTTIANGVDTEKFRPQVQEPREVVEIGTIGRLDPIKNFPCLIRAMALLNKGVTKPAYRLTIVGAGDEQPRLESLVNSLDLGDCVRLAGASDKPEDWYREFDIFVNCSFSEGMSNTVLEGMACGLPIVATAIDGHREWLDAEDNALFFQSDSPESLADALRRLGRDAALRTRMGALNREKIVSGYSQVRFAHNYMTLYGELLSAHGISFDFGNP